MASATARVMITGPTNLYCVKLHNFQKNKRKKCCNDFQEFRTGYFGYIKPGNTYTNWADKLW